MFELSKRATLTVAAAIFFMSGCDWLPINRPPETPPPDTIDDGLVAHYSFDDGRVIDESGNENHCRLFGNPSAVNGVVGKALRLDGTDDYANCGSGDAFDFERAITISAWLRPFTLDNTGSSDWIAGKWKTRGTRGAWLLGIKTRRRPNIGVNSDERNYHEAIAETQVPLGSFSHIVGTYDHENDRARVYVNGWLANTTEEEIGSIFVSRSDVLLGATRYATDSERFEDYLHGDLDEIRFYNRALDSSEVHKLYRRGSE
jgi:hypothetical protein